MKPRWGSGPNKNSMMIRIMAKLLAGEIRAKGTPVGLMESGGLIAHSSTLEPKNSPLAGIFCREPVSFSSLLISLFRPHRSSPGSFSPALPVSGYATPGGGTRGSQRSVITKPSSFLFPFRFVFPCIDFRVRGPVTTLLSALDRAALAHSGRDPQSWQKPPLDEKPYRDHDHQQQQIIHFHPS
jgi:hypothetical protein